MRTAYIRLTRFWPRSGAGVNTNAEVQLEPRPDEDAMTDNRVTSLQVFSRRTGDPIGGLLVFDRDQLAELHTAIGERLAELASITESPDTKGN